MPFSRMSPDGLVAAITAGGVAVATQYGAQYEGIPHDTSIGLAVIAFIAAWIGMNQFLESS